MGSLWEKVSHRPPNIHLLGADLSFDTVELSARLPARCKVDWAGDINQILAYNQLNPGQAAKLRGRLGFPQSLLFGKAGRALLQPPPDANIRKPLVGRIRSPRS